MSPQTPAVSKNKASAATKKSKPHQAISPELGERESRTPGDNAPKVLGSVAQENEAPGSAAHGDVSHGDAGHGEVSLGNAAHGDAGHGSAAHGDVSHGDAGHGDVSHGNAAQGEVSLGNAAHGDAAHDASDEHCNCSYCRSGRSVRHLLDQESGLIPSDDVEVLAAFFKALSDPSRLNIVCVLLTYNELSVGDIAAHTKMSISAVSHQLAILRMRNLVTVQKQGVKNIYKLSDHHVSKVIELAIEHICE